MFLSQFIRKLKPTMLGVLGIRTSLRHRRLFRTEPLESRSLLAADSPFVQSIVREANSSVLAGSTGVFTVTFSEPVSGVNVADFQVTTTGTSTANSVLTVNKINSSVYRVTVTGISGAGTVGVNLIDDLSIRDSSGLGLVSNRISFQSRGIATVGATPYTITTADVSGDGILDVIVPNFDGDTIGILRGNGNGTFQTQQSFPVSDSPIHVAVADLNNDGKQDLVVANHRSNTVGILIGNGDGTFQAQVSYATGSYPQAVAVGDLNGDGKPDLAVAKYGDSAVGIHLGNGDGTFQSVANFGVGSGAGPTSVVLADMDDDARLDIVTSNVSSQSIAVLRGNGNGSFQLPQLTPTGSSSVQAVVADLNLDGFQDIATANRGVGTIGVFKGNGDGTLQVQETYSSPGIPEALAVADANNDGIPDLVTANYTGGTLLVLQGAGDGSFRTVQTHSLNSNTYGIATGDLNRDGKSDVVATNSELGSISVFLNNSGVFQGGQKYKISNSAFPGLVSDLSIRSIGFGSPQGIMKIGNLTYFIHDDGIHGDELWKSDGTSAGTVMVRDLVPGSVGSDIFGLQNVNGRLFFFASNGSINGINAPGGTELFTSDGTSAGTTIVKEIYPGGDGISYDAGNIYVGVKSAVVGNVLYFSADDGVHGVELWRSDGTAAGTFLVKDLVPGAGGGMFTAMSNVGGRLYFAIGSELWTSDGQASGTIKLKSFAVPQGLGNYGAPESLTNFNGTLFFTASDGSSGYELWKSDGSVSGTTRVADIASGSGSSDPGGLTVIGNTLYFSATGATGRELWKTTGVSSGTSLVAEINSSGSSNPTSLRNVNGTLYFSANNGSHGDELWKSDGTSGGTVMVKDIFPGSTGSGISEMVTVGTSVCFFANDGSSGRELWRSDGTSSGTSLVKDIVAGASSSEPYNLRAFGTDVWFFANDGIDGPELWRSNGTIFSSGVSLVSPLDYRAFRSSSPFMLQPIGNSVLFNTRQSPSGIAVSSWISDGSAAGTVQLAPTNITQSTAVGSIVYFVASDTAHGSELWRTDGTASGTYFLQDIQPGTAGSNIRNLTNVNGTLFFVATTSANGTELWKSDGTAAGTQLVADVRTGSPSSLPHDLINLNGTLYFVANDGAGDDLWRSNGALATTSIVRDSALASPGSFDSLTNVNGVLYFHGSGASIGGELWKTDGTSSNTVLVKDLFPGSALNHGSPRRLTNHNGRLFFTATDGTGEEIWTSDGTANGTQKVTDFPGLYPFGELIIAGDWVYFSASSDGSDYDLWQTDGTTANTRKLMDFDVPPVQRGPRFLTNVAGKLYFNATDAVHGDELWVSDGTVAGTKIVADIVQGSGGSYPSGLTAVGNTLFFAASTESTGRELWQIRNVNAAPTELQFSQNVLQVAENAVLQADLLIGTFQYQDDGIGANAVQITGANASMFRVSGDSVYLKSTAVLDYESSSSLTFTIQIDDPSVGSIPDTSVVVVLNLQDMPDGTSGVDSILLTYSLTNVTVTRSTNGSTPVSQGTFPLNAPLTVSALSNVDSVRIVGTPGADTFSLTNSGYLINGASLMLAGPAVRTLAGAAGDDVYLFDADLPLGQITLDESGGGIDTLNFSNTATGIVLDLGISTMQPVNGSLSLNLQASSVFENAVGSTGEDVLRGNNLNNAISGMSGNDTMIGGDGSDTLTGGLGDDSYTFTAATAAENDVIVENAGGGTDTIDFSNVNSAVTFNLQSTSSQVVHSSRTLKLNSGAAIEKLIGSSVNDNLAGNTLANTLTGGGGNDRLTGNGGNDNLIGGLGDDLYVFAPATSNESDAVVELFGEGTDTLSFSTLSLSTVLNLGSTLLQTVHSNRTLTLSSNATIENVQGGSGADSLTGNSLNNVLTGNDGNDSLNGMAGSDSLAGGLGDDIYVMIHATSAESDVLTETTNAGTDTINFNSLAANVTFSLASTLVQPVHLNRTVKLNSGSTFENVAGGDGMDILVGNSSANVLVGNKGDDQLQGNGGRDILIGSNGLDTLQGGADEDILIAGRTDYDAMFASLNTLLSAWIAPDLYAIRVASLKAGVGPSSVKLLPATTVFNDASPADSLNGGTESDWFFHALNDVIADLFGGEITSLL